MFITRALLSRRFRARDPSGLIVLRLVIVTSAYYCDSISFCVHTRKTNAGTQIHHRSPPSLSHLGNSTAILAVPSSSSRYISLLGRVSSSIFLRTSALSSPTPPSTSSSFTTVADAVPAAFLFLAFLAHPPPPPLSNFLPRYVSPRLTLSLPSRRTYALTCGTRSYVADGGGASA